MKITRFEDIEAWRSARKLMNLIHDVTEFDAFRADPDLRRQMRRASTSSMANIAEGFDSGSNPEFLRYLRIAQRSSTEIQSPLYVCIDRGYCDQKTFDSVYRKANDVKNLTGGFIRYLQPAIAREKATRTNRRKRTPNNESQTTG